MKRPNMCPRGGGSSFKDVLGTLTKKVKMNLQFVQQNVIVSFQHLSKIIGGNELLNLDPVCIGPSRHITKQ